MNAHEILRYFPNASASTIRANTEVGGVAGGAQREHGVGNEPVGTAQAPRDDPVRRFVRITSFRRRLLDERNLHDKAFVDALQYAGIIHSDSPQWVQVEVRQEKVSGPEQERTEIEIGGWNEQQVIP